MGTRILWTSVAVLCGCSGADGSFTTGPSAKPDAVTIDAGRAAPATKDAQSAAPIVEPYDAGYCEPLTCDSPALASRTGSQDDGCGGFVFCAIKPAPSVSATPSMDAGAPVDNAAANDSATPSDGALGVDVAATTEDAAIIVDAAPQNDAPAESGLVCQSHCIPSYPYVAIAGCIPGYPHAPVARSYTPDQKVNDCWVDSECCSGVCRDMAVHGAWSPSGVCN